MSEVDKHFQKLSVGNFKSIREMDIDCARVNIFIGPPNGGKSNILEALGLISWMEHLANEQTVFSQGKAFRWLRAKDEQELFHASDTTKKVFVKTSGTKKRYRRVALKKNGNIYTCKLTTEKPTSFCEVLSSGKFKPLQVGREPMEPFIKFYRYPTVVQRGRTAGTSYLQPPAGSNMAEALVVRENEDFRSAVVSILKKSGFTPLKRGQAIEFQAWFDEIALSFEGHLVSETLKRLLFHLGAVLTNKDSAITMEEPEAHMFPETITGLSSRIATSQTNQFFITTHSAEMLYTLASEMRGTPDEFKCFAVYMEAHQTKAVEIPHEKALHYATDIMFNLEDFIGDENV